MFYNLKMNALACLFLMTGSAIQAAENIPPSQAADKDGSFISKTRDSIPPFPSSVRGFYYDPGKDFWGEPFRETGSIRVFEGDNWVGLADFPNTSNGCSSGRFYRIKALSVPLSNGSQQRRLRQQAAILQKWLSGQLYGWITSGRSESVAGTANTGQGASLCDAAA
jgi:hypothetical protein